MVSLKQNDAFQSYYYLFLDIQMPFLWIDHCETNRKLYCRFFAPTSGWQFSRNALSRGHAATNTCSPLAKEPDRFLRAEKESARFVEYWLFKSAPKVRKCMHKIEVYVSGALFLLLFRERRAEKNRPPWFKTVRFQ